MVKVDWPDLLLVRTGVFDIPQLLCAIHQGRCAKYRDIKGAWMMRASYFSLLADVVDRDRGQ